MKAGFGFESHIRHCIRIADHLYSVSNVVMDMFTWLGYANSMVNPIIYGLSMRDFKDTLQVYFLWCSAFCLPANFCNFFVNLSLGMDTLPDVGYLCTSYVVYLITYVINLCKLSLMASSNLN